MPEKRKTERVKAMIFTTVYDRDAKSLLGFLGDLTLEGAMVVGEKPVEPDRDITIQIEFTGSDDVPQARLNIRAYIAWCKKEENSSYYNTGFEFLDLNGRNRQIVESYVVKYRFGAYPAR